MSQDKKVLALKYRPKKFDELVGQKSISQTLELALDSDKLSHAYLFSGLRGSGKTSTARIFAKALICQEGVSHSSCEKCENCLAANIGKHIDIIEMDGASNRKIDDIRDLIEQTRYKPSMARYKIFIIDEVHMLTKEAFNALLKTLEEPPEFVKFILATTDPLKLPPTILSRTQHFRFKKIPQGDVLRHLENILNIENVNFEEKALEIIARSGNGSLRDTLTLLDQAIVFCKGDIDTNGVVSMLGILDPKQIEYFFDRILEKDREKALELVASIEDYDSEMLIDELMSFLKEKLIRGDRRFTTFILDRFFRVVSDGKSLLAVGADSGFVLGLTVLKMIEALKTNAIDEEIGKLEAQIEKLPEKKAVPQPQQTVAQPTAEEPTPTTPVQEQVTPESVQPQTQVQKPEPVAKPEPPKAPEVDYSRKFDDLVDKLFDRNFELGTCFKGGVEFVSYTDGELTWISCVDGECKQMLKQYWATIKQLIDEVFGIGTSVKMNPCDKEPEPIKEEPRQESVEQPSNDDKTGEGINGGSCVMANAGINPEPKKESPEDIMKDPFVEKAIELFEPEGIRVISKV
ncbi:MAG: DNA polymerase III subunit gamma/tau [Campylobacterales bacterium]|nr:DNA polymerase III subunit gamma/tau [Campylobacterales bacterium]